MPRFIRSHFSKSWSLLESSRTKTHRLFCCYYGHNSLFQLTNQSSSRPYLSKVIRKIHQKTSETRLVKRVCGWECFFSKIPFTKFDRKWPHFVFFDYIVPNSATLWAKFVLQKCRKTENSHTAGKPWHMSISDVSIYCLK